MFKNENDDDYFEEDFLWRDSKFWDGDAFIGELLYDEENLHIDINNKLDIDFDT